MGRKFLHIEDRYSVGCKYPFGSEQAEIGKMFLVNGVELVLIYQLQEVWELDCGDPQRREQQFHPADKIIQVWNMSHSVVDYQQVGPFAISNQFTGSLFSEEPDKSGHAFFDCHLGHVCCRIDAERGDALLDEVLEKVTIIAAQLDHAAVAIESKTINHVVHVLAGMLKPAFGVGRKIGILAEDRFRADVCGHLYEK